MLQLFNWKRIPQEFSPRHLEHCFRTFFVLCTNVVYQFLLDRWTFELINGSNDFIKTSFMN